jgi:hypothetical protein
VVEVKECTSDELLRVGLTEELACWIVMVKSVVVKKIQRSCRVLLLKVRMKVELVVACGGQSETEMRMMEHEALLCSWSCVLNVVLLKNPAIKDRKASNWEL